MTDERSRRPVTKSSSAFRTISEVATELGIAQHVLRYWEGRFPQLKPLQRAGNRRLYRPEDVDLARRIHRLLNAEGYSIRGAQKLLADDGTLPGETDDVLTTTDGRIAYPQLAELEAIRTLLRTALER